MEIESFDYKAFVIMPFDEEFNNLYKLVIKEACNKANVSCTRVDEESNIPDHIVEKIYKCIRDADIIIADLTGANPNVYYELGYAKAHGKNIISITQSYDDLKFDFKSYSVHKYDLKTMHLFRDDLARMISDKLKYPSNGFDILGIYPQSADLQTIIGKMISYSKETIYFSGVHFGIHTSDRRNDLVKKLNEGVSITYHVLDPESDTVKAIAKSFEMRDEELISECKNGIKVLEGLKMDAGEGASNLKIIVSSKPPQARYMLFDHQNERGRVFVTPFVDGLRSSHTPSYQFRSKAEPARCYIDCCLKAISKGQELKLP